MFLLNVSLSQSVFYVSPSGSDSSDGNEPHPWRTIKKAFNSATPGSYETDFDGLPRVYNNRVDAGAYEKVFVILPVPELIETMNDDIVGTPPVRMRWTASDSGSQYCVQIAADSDFTILCVDVPVDSVLTHPPDLIISDFYA